MDTKLQNSNTPEAEIDQAEIGRRELIERFGKIGLYALPFSLLAFTTKPAAAASCAKGFGGCGGGGGTPKK